MIYKTNYIKVFAGILLIWVINVNTFAQQADSLEYYIEMAGENNARIKSSFLKYKSSLEAIPQAGAYPDPTLDIGFFLKPMNIIDGKEVANFQLMQMFPWFGTRKAARTEAQQLAKVAYEEFRIAVNELYLNVYTQWYEMSSLQQQQKNVNENRRLLEKLEKLATRKYSSPNANASSSGSGGMADVLRIQLEIAELEDRALSIEAEINTKKAAFNALLNRSSQSHISVPDTIIQSDYMLDMEFAFNQMEKLNPRLSIITEEKLAYEAKAEADKKRSYPTIGVGVQYSIINKRNNALLPVSDMNGMNMFMPMVSVSLPIYRGKYKAQQKESELAALSNIEQLQDTRNMLEAELQQVNYELNDASRKVQLYRKQAKLAETAYKLMVQEFITGKSDLNDLIQVQRQLLDYSFKEADAIADYNTVVASIQNLITFNTPEQFNTK